MLPSDAGKSDDCIFVDVGLCKNFATLIHAGSASPRLYIIFSFEMVCCAERLMGA